MDIQIFSILFKMALFLPDRGKLCRGIFSSEKIIYHLENILSLFPDENFRQLYLRETIF